MVLKDTDIESTDDGLLKVAEPLEAKEILSDFKILTLLNFLGNREKDNDLTSIACNLKS